MKVEQSIMNLFPSEPPLPRASRLTDPSSSHLAEKAHKRNRLRNIDRVKECLIKVDGLTSSEIAERIGMDRVEVRRRLTDLHKLEWATPGAVRKSNIAGGRAEQSWWRDK